MASTRIRGNTQIIAGSITNAELNASAAIATTKLADGAEFVKRDGSVALTGNFDAGNQRLTNVGTPTSANDATNKAYVDALAAGVDVRGSVRAATTANIADLGAATVTHDDVTCVEGDRLLVKNQSTGSQNGIYVVGTVNTGVAPLTRATDADISAEVTPGMFCFVEEGTLYGDTGWVLSTNGPITLGTTALTFTQYSSAGVIQAGAGLTQTGTTLDVVSANTGIAVNANDIALTLNGTTLEISSGLRVKAAGITSNELATNAVVTAAITNDAVTSDKLHSSVAGTGITFTDGVLTPNAAVVQLVANIVTRETPSGTVNGSNTAFVLAATPVAGSEQVYLNGILQDAGSGNDYTISGATITFETAPVSPDKIRVSYLK